MVLSIHVTYNLKISIYSIFKIIYVGRARRGRVGVNIGYIIGNIDDVALYGLTFCSLK